MKLGKKISAITLAGVMIVGHSIAALAALSGFTVSNPSMTNLNGKYIVSGGVSYNSTSGSGTLYLQDAVYAYTYDANGMIISDSKMGYGWNAASATTDGMRSKPFKIINIGSYKSGSSFIEVGRKEINY